MRILILGAFFLTIGFSASASERRKAGILLNVDSEVAAIISHTDFSRVLESAKKESSLPIYAAGGFITEPESGRGIAGVTIFQVRPGADGRSKCEDKMSIGEIVADITYGGTNGRTILEVNNLRYDSYSSYPPNGPRPASQCMSKGLESAWPF